MWVKSIWEFFALFLQLFCQFEIISKLKTFKKIKNIQYTKLKSKAVKTKKKTFHSQKNY